MGGPPDCNRRGTRKSEAHFGRLNKWTLHINRSQAALGLGSPPLPLAYFGVFFLHFVCNPQKVKIMLDCTNKSFTENVFCVQMSSFLCYLLVSSPLTLLCRSRLLSSSLSSSPPLSSTPVSPPLLSLLLSFPPLCCPLLSPLSPSPVRNHRLADERCGAVWDCLDVVLNKMLETVFLRCFFTSHPFYVCLCVSTCVFTPASMEVGRRGRAGEGQRAQVCT